jgi:hypothetical protein
VFVFSYESRFISNLPIRTTSLDDPADKTRQEHMIALVEQMLELHDRLSTAQSKADQEVYKRQINSTDAEIDKLVYELYGLTEEEIAIVEGEK